MSSLLDELKSVFFDEAREGLEIMESSLMALDQSPEDSDLVNQLFRAAHSIKGGAGSFGYGFISTFTHDMETLLDDVRAGRRGLDGACIDVLLQSVDHLRSLVEVASDGGEIDQERSNQLGAQLKDLIAGGSGSITAEPEEEVDTPEPVQAPVLEAGFFIEMVPHPGLMTTGNDPSLIFGELASLGAVEVEAETERVPALELLDPEQLFISWKLTLQGGATEADIREVFDWVESDCDLRIDAADSPSAEDSPPEAPPVAEGAPAESNALAAAAPTADPATGAKVGATKTPAPEKRSAEKSDKGAAAASSIRVGIEKIDDLIDIVGELVITQSMLCQVEKELDLSRLDRLRDGLAELTRNTRELQESVMRIRMLPISFVFSRFPRLVRDVRGKLGKKVELVMKGESTEVDKTVAEQLADPLVHLVRNALDHGMESPEARVQAGKPETGTITLEARHEGGKVIIDITDDGGGINPDKVLAKAREKGLVSASERPSDERIYDLLFQPGFSTADTVSDLSGRGVGLDVVSKNIRSLGGTIETQSKVGHGTSFRIRLPLTLSILDGQLVSIGRQTMVIPLLSIVESVQVRKEQINQIAGSSEIYRLRDQYIPMVRSAELLGLSPEKQGSSYGLLVVVEGEGTRVGVLVDDLLDQQQVVIKSLETNFRPVPGFSGATILGDGRVALILDVGGIVRLADAKPLSIEQLARTERPGSGQRART